MEKVKSYNDNEPNTTLRDFSHRPPPLFPSLHAYGYLRHIWVIIQCMPQCHEQGRGNAPLISTLSVPGLICELSLPPEGLHSVSSLGSQCTRAPNNMMVLYLRRECVCVRMCV